MFIEVLNYENHGCKAKCPTCPQMVSGPNSGPHADLLFEALNRIKNKFPTEEIKFSLMNDIVDLPRELQKLSFDITKINGSLGCNIKMPFDSKMVELVFSHIGLIIPEAKVALFLENRGFLADYSKDILKLAEIFTSSIISDLTIACHNNSMRTTIFDQSIEKTVERNMGLFKQILSLYPTDSFQKTLEENLIPMDPKNYRQFLNILQLKIGSQNLRVSERILSFEDNLIGMDDLIDFYRDFFVNESKGGTFKKENIGLAFTPIGVRVNHRSIDIKNPHLWLNYDEFFELLEMADTLDIFCDKLKTHLTRTGLIPFKVSMVSFETINLIANARKQVSL